MNESTAEDKDNVLPFRKPVYAKPSNADIIGYNWLADLPVGSAFLARPRPKGMNKDMFCSEIHIAFHGFKTTRIVVVTEEGNKPFWPITQEFSNANELIEVLYDPRQQQDGNTNTDGEGDRPNPEQRVGKPSDDQGNPAMQQGEGSDGSSS